MWIVRKIEGGIKCIQDNGCYYTWHHFVGKIGRRVMALGISRALGHALLRYAHESAQFRYVNAGEYLDRGSEYKAKCKPCDITKKSIGVFAVFTMDGLIPESTLYYLRSLKKITEYVVCVGDCRLMPSMAVRLAEMVDEYEFVRHCTYDFGSYRRGLEIARICGAIGDDTDLIFANDSCYGPVFPLSEVMDKMHLRECDFWGMTVNKMREGVHIQSYFYYLKNIVIKSGLIDDFLNNAREIKGRQDAIENFEKKFTKCLEGKGFVADSFIRYLEGRTNPTTFPITLLRLRCPLIKRKALLGESHESTRLARKIIRELNPVLYNHIMYDLYKRR